MFKPLSWLFTVAGVSPSSSPRDKYVTCAVLAITLVAFYHTHTSLGEKYPGLSKVLILKLNALYFNTTLFIVSSYVNRKSLPAVMSKAYCSSPGFEAFLLAALIVSCALKWIDIHATFGNLAFSTSNFIIYSVSHVILAQHMLLVRGLTLRFTSLNDRILSFIAQTRANPLANFKGPLNSVIVEHWNLHEVITKINSRYSFYFMVFMAGKLAFLVENIYRALMNISQEGYTTSVHFSVIFLVAAAVVVPMFLCQICSDQAQRSVLLAHELWNIDGSADMMMDVKVFFLALRKKPVKFSAGVKVFSLALRKKPVKFSAGGVFTLDCRFITKFSITALTYLIIAVQLGGQRHSDSLVSFTTETAGSTME